MFVCLFYCMYDKSSHGIGLQVVIIFQEIKVYEDVINFIVLHYIHQDIIYIKCNIGISNNPGTASCNAHLKILRIKISQKYKLKKK